MEIYAKSGIYAMLKITIVSASHVVVTESTLMRKLILDVVRLVPHIMHSRDRCEPVGIIYYALRGASRELTSADLMTHSNPTPTARLLLPYTLENLRSCVPEWNR